MRTAIASLCLLCFGCAGLQQHVMLTDGDKHDARCESLEKRYEIWGAVGAGAGALSAAGVLLTPPVDSENVRFGASVIAAGLIALATAAVFVRDDVADLYGAECEDIGDLGLTVTSTVSE